MGLHYAHEGQSRHRTWKGVPPAMAARQRRYELQQGLTPSCSTFSSSCFSFLLSLILSFFLSFFLSLYIFLFSPVPNKVHILGAADALSALWQDLLSGVLQGRHSDPKPVLSLASSCVHVLHPAGPPLRRRALEVGQPRLRWRARDVLRGRPPPHPREGR